MKWILSYKLYYNKIMFDLFFTNKKSLKNEIQNLEDFGIDEIENINNKEIFKEKLSTYEYFSDDEI